MVSNLLGVVLWSYFVVGFTLIVAFANIYSIDKIEFMYNEQQCIELKFTAFFIIQKSKNKKIVSKKTFALESIGYIILFFMLTLLVVGLFSNTKIAIILLGVSALAVCAFGIVTGFLYRKAKKINFNA